MQIPLNIDWQQILLHLFNFAILTAGLYFLLYKPVKKFMADRVEHYRQMDEAAQEKMAKANELEASYQARLSDVDEELRQKRSQSARKAQQSADEQIQLARQQAEKILSEAQESAQRERKKVLAEAQEEIAELAAAAAEKLMQNSLDLDSECDRFLDAVREGHPHEE